METRASYILVGAFVLSLAAVGFAIVIWLAKIEFEEVRERHLVYFSGSVTGLAIGSPVRYRGVPVGSVTSIRIDPNNVERIEVVIEVAEGTPIKQDTVATLGVQGITGVAYILLTGGTQGSRNLTLLPGQKMSVISSRASGLQQVLEQAPELFGRAVTLMGRLTRMFDDRNLKSLAESLDNFRNMSETLAKSMKGVDGLLESSTKTMASFRSAAKNFEALSSDLRKRTRRLAASAGNTLADVQVTLTGIRKAASDFDKLATKLDKVVEENRTPIRDFSSGGLYELSQFIAESRVLVAALTRLSAQIERDPARFFFGDTQKGFEAK